MTTMEPQSAAPANEAPLDRGISPIAGRFGTGRRGKMLGLAGLMIGCAAFAAVTWRHAPAKTKVPDQPARQMVAFEPATPPTLAAPGRNAPSLTGQPEIPGGPPGATSSTAAAKPSAAQEAADTAAKAQAAALQTVRAAPLMAVAHEGGGGLAGAFGIPALAQTSAHTETELEQLRHGSAIGTARARRLGDRSFLILAGTSIPCILQTVLGHEAQAQHPCFEVRVRLDGAALAARRHEARDGDAQRQARLATVAIRPVREHAAASKPTGHQARISVGMDQVAGRGDLRARHAAFDVAAGVRRRCIELQ